MTRTLFTIFILISAVGSSSLLLAKVCPKNSFWVEQDWPEKTSQTYAKAECHNEPFYFGGCGRFYEDVICDYWTKDRKYWLYKILPDGSDTGRSYGFKGGKPPKCGDRPAVRIHEAPDRYHYDVRLKNGKDLRFVRLKCQKQTGKLDGFAYSKTRCLYQSRKAKGLRLYETTVEKGLARSRRHYMTGCK